MWNIILLIVILTPIELLIVLAIAKWIKNGTKTEDKEEND